MLTATEHTIRNFIGKETGTSDWITIDQDRISQFADVTEDHQFIHVDPDAAKMTTFGTTIAHGFLSLSMLSAMSDICVITMDGEQIGVNYGFDKVRFIAPVKSGKRIRGIFTLISVDQKAPDQWLFKYGVKVEIEGEDKPALVAEWLCMQIV